MAKQNIEKTPPKGSVKFSITLSEEQKAAKQAMLHHPYNFIVGKAGSGKTLLACQVALDMFFKRMINKIIITRPTVSTEDNGFLPGSEKEKMEPWLVPIRSNMRKVYNKPLILEKMEKEESIELVSLAHFRGRTFENSIVIIDEFQNLTRSQLRMALGRLGKGSTMVFCGDNQQIDLKDKNYSAIVDVSKLTDSQYVYKRILLDNHRHPAIDNVFEMLMGM
jgi:phosphate starvation-inducible protein PhoH and related proteins|tara:strand:+ start:214 stop:876 length:663 start_codon:yes stop_codon:yes gene_type:complete